MSVIEFPQLRIEPLTHIRLGAASKFLHDNWHRNYQDQLPEDIVDERTAEYFKRYLMHKQGLVWIACLGEHVVGLVTVAANCIDELWVEKKYQRRKIGSRLVDTAIGHFKQKGYTSAQVGFERLNRSAGAFFHSRRWKNIGSEYIDLEPGKSIEALVYSTKITPASKQESYR